MSLQAGRPKKSILFGHLFLNITIVFCAKKTGGACLCMLYAAGWSLPSQFWSYTPQKLFFRGQKNENSPWKTGCARPLLKKKSQTPIWIVFFFFGYFCRKLQILSRRCRLSRTTSDPAKKSGNFQRPKFAFFLYFSGKKMARSCHAVLDFRVHQGLPPDWVDHARSIAMPDPNRRWRLSRFLAYSFFKHEHRQKKFVSKGPASNPNLHSKISP